MAKPWEQYQQEDKKPWETYAQTKPVEPVASEPKPERGFMEEAAGVGEAALAMGSSIIAEPVAGIAGIVQGLNPFAEEGAGVEAIKATKEALTYQPRGEAAKEDIQAVGEFIAPIAEPITKGMKAATDYTYELTGSPAAAAAVGTAPTLLAELLGLGVVRKIRKGARLIDDMGNPTNKLRKALDKDGLVYENLSEAAKKTIPDIADPKLIPSPSSETAKAAENVLIQQIKSGARDDALASLKIVGNKIKPDLLANKALSQGFDPSFVQAVKTSTPQTKRAMNDMLTIMNRVVKNRKVALETRPTDIVGTEVMKRVTFIKDKAKAARLDLDNVANTELKGMVLPDDKLGNITAKLSESLDNLDIKLDDGIAGIPKPDFKGSMISKDKTSQRVIKDLIDLMGEGGRPDALRMHKLKRQLDTMIDFRKKSVGGLTKAGENVLKDIRYELNQTLRNANPKYAKANDTLSSSIGAIDGFKKAVGPSIDIFGEGAEKAIGTDLRGLLSNRKSRIKLDNSLNQLDDVASELGGSFKVNYKDLADFANGIENRFGSVAKTSFKGDIESAIKTTKEASERGAAATATKMGIDKAAEIANKLRGKNDFNAFKSMRDLLRDSQQSTK